MSETPPIQPPVASELPYQFRRANFFRVIHADGVWYSFSPSGHLHLYFFNENQSLPDAIVGKVENGMLIGEYEDKRTGPKGILREIEVDIVMSLDAAHALSMTLAQNIKATTEMLKGQAAPK